MVQKQMEYYLADDIGASSGRHILGYIEEGKLKLEEVYRFQKLILYYLIKRIRFLEKRLVTETNVRKEWRELLILI